MIYSAFKTLATSIISRRDMTTAQLQGFVTLAIARINREISDADFMEVDEELTADSDGAITPPCGYKKLKSLYNGTHEYRYKRNGEFIRYDSESGDPLFYTRRAGKWYFAPALAEGDTVHLTYMTDNVVPVEDSDETPLLKKQADLLLHAVCRFAGVVFQDDRRDDFENMYLQAKQEVLDRYSEQLMSEGPHEVGPSSDSPY